MPLLLAGISHPNLIKAPEHKHDYYEVIININGEGTSIIGKNEFTFVPGTIHIIPPNINHQKISQFGFQDIYFISSSTLFHNYFNSQSVPIILHDDKEQTLYKFMTILVSRFQKQKRYDPVLEATHQAIIQQLNEWNKQIDTDTIINEVISHIENSFNFPDFTVSDALSITGYNIDYIRRRFYTVTGTTPINYLTNHRIEYAKHLLSHQQELHLSISEIASLSGYFDVCYFSRLFKKKVGISPSNYANQEKKRTISNSL